MTNQVKDKTHFYDVYEFIGVVGMLAESQGFYGRLLERIMELEFYDPEGFEDFKVLIEDQKFTDPVDVILFIEQG